MPEEALCAVKRLPARVFQSVAVFSDYWRLLEPKVPMFDEVVVTVPKLASLPLNVPLSVWISNFVSPTKFWLRLVDGKNPYIRRFVAGLRDTPVRRRNRPVLRGRHQALLWPTWHAPWSRTCFAKRGTYICRLKFSSSIMVTRLSWVWTGCFAR